MTLAQFSCYKGTYHATSNNHVVTLLHLLHTLFTDPLCKDILNWQLDHYITIGPTQRVATSCPSQYMILNTYAKQYGFLQDIEKRISGQKMFFVDSVISSTKVVKDKLVHHRNLE